MITMKKIIIIIAIAVVLTAISIVLTASMLFLRYTSPSVSESKEKPVAAQETPEMNYTIPSAATVTVTPQEIEQAKNKTEENRKIINEREAEAESARAARRAEAFAKQKALEASLMHAEDESAEKNPAPPLPRKKATPPSEEDLKKLESEGILTY